MNDPHRPFPPVDQHPPAPSQASAHDPQGSAQHMPQHQAYGQMPQHLAPGQVPPHQTYGQAPQHHGYGQVPPHQTYGQAPQHHGYGQAPQHHGYGQAPQHHGYGHHGYGQAPQHQPTFGHPHAPLAPSGTGVDPTEDEEDSSWSREIFAAILYGHGFEDPRKRGRDFLGLSALALVFNLVLIFVFNAYYVLLALLPGLLFPAGLWLLVVGAPGRSEDGRPASWWSRLGFAVSLLAGLPLCWLLLVFFHGG